MKFTLIIALLFSTTAFATDPHIIKKALAETSQGDALLLDVRENREVARGRVKGALVFPTSKVGSKEWDNFVSSLNKEKTIYIYCAVGGRSEKVAKELRKRGFRAHNAGGIDDLRKEGADTH